MPFPLPCFSVKPTLEGKLCLLRPFAEEDLPFLLKILEEPEVNSLTGSVETTEEARSVRLDGDEETLGWYRSRHAQEDRLDLAVVDRATGRCVGEAVLNEWNDNAASVNLRILIGRAGQGRGLGSEAVALTVRYGFEVLGLHRIELEVYAFNPRARRVYEKAGFVREGTRRQVFRFDGQWVDAEVMALLREDWDRNTAGLPVS